MSSLKIVIITFDKCLSLRFHLAIMFAYKSLISMLVMAGALTASMSNAQSITIHPEDAGKLAKNETSKPLVIAEHPNDVHPVQAPIPAAIPFRSKEQKKNAHHRRLLHYVIHSALEAELEDLLDVAFDESMVTHEDVAEVQQCISKPILKHLTECLTESEEHEKAHKNKKEEVHPPHVIDPKHKTVNGTEHAPKPLADVKDHKSAKEQNDEDALALLLHPVVMQCLTHEETKRISLCIDDQTFKIIEDNLDLIEDLEDFDTDHKNIDEMEKLDELEELEEVEKLKELEEIQEAEKHHHRHHHHGNSHHHHAHNNHHHHGVHHDHDNVEERKLKELELLETGFKPTKSTLPMDEHLRRDELQSPGEKGHMVLEKRKFGYGPDWATLVGKRDVHPLP